MKQPRRWERLKERDSGELVGRWRQLVLPGLDFCVRIYPERCVELLE